MNNEQLFQQRLQERTGTGGQYQQVQVPTQAQGNPYFQIDLSQLPPASVQASSLNPTPDKIMQFAQMDHSSRLQLAQTNQQLYADIVNSVQRVQQSSSSFSPPQHQPQLPSQHQPPLPSQHQSALQPQPPQHQPPPQQYGQFNNEEDDSSELSNHHSSDEELNGPTNTSAQRQTISTAVMQQPQSFRSVVRHKPSMSYLPIDFRADLVDIGSFMRYQVQFSKRHNVRSVKLTEFIVNVRPELLQEPYVFIKIDEIEGNYKLGGRFNTTVFGKLVQDKTMNGFLFYKPEQCSIRFGEPQRLTNLTVSLLKYDMTPISLSKLVVSDIKKSANFIRLVCSDDHYLHPSNAVAITYDSEDGRTTTERLEILDIPTLNSVVLQKPQNMVFNRNVSFEVLNIKCSMTFKLT